MSNAQYTKLLLHDIQYNEICDPIFKSFIQQHALK